MGLGARRRGQQASRQPEAAETPDATLARVRERLSVYLEIGRAGGGRDADVSVRHVLDLLDPNGTWRLVREEKTGQAPEMPGNLDPMTGCLPVSPPTR